MARSHGPYGRRRNAPLGAMSARSEWHAVRDMHDRTGKEVAMAIDVRDPHVALERRVARRLRDDDSHRRVSAVLAEVAAAAIHPRVDPLSGRRRMNGLLEDPVASATRVAVETLIDELDDLVDALAPEALARLAAEQVAADLGIE
jgi:hypothetical protein